MQLGSVVYNNLAAAALGPGAANNGLSVSGGIVQLGGPLGSAGAAVLLNNREIPFNSQQLLFSGLGTNAASFVALSQSNTIAPNTPMIQFQAFGGGQMANLIVNPRDIYFGLNAGNALTAINLQNTVVGGNAAPALTSGTNNCFFGWQSGNTITTGSGNVAVGFNAFENATTTSSNNTCIGGSAGQQSVSSGPVTAITCIGNGAGQQQPMGVGTVCIGFKAAFNQTDGGSNIYIGNTCWGTAIVASGIGSNNIFIGANQNATGGFGPLSNCNLIGAGIIIDTANVTNTSIFGTGYTTSVSNICVIGVGTAGQNTMIGPPNNQADLNSVLQVFGSLSMPISSIATSTSIGSGNFTVICTATLTLTLQAASTNKGRIYCIIAQGAAVVTTNVTFINLAGVGVTTIAAGTSVMLQSDGTNWQQIK